jgi:GAF domain-containing protein
MNVDEHEVPRYVAATDEDARALDRWPELAALLADQSGRGVLGVPVRLAGVPVASLNVYCDRPHDWDDSEGEAISAVAKVLDLLDEDS